MFQVGHCICSGNLHKHGLLLTIKCECLGVLSLVCSCADRSSGLCSYCSYRVYEPFCSGSRFTALSIWLAGSLPKWYKGYHSNSIRDHHVVSDIKIFVDSLYARVLKLCVVWESLHSITQGVLSHGKGIAKRGYENGRNRT